MKQIIRPTGIEVEIPSAYDITDVAPGFRRGGSAFAGTPPEPGVITDVLIEALREHELVLMDEIPVTPSATPAPDRGVRRRGAAEEKMSSRITVPLAEEDEAVVLLEQDGAYSWVFPQDQPDGGRRRSSVAAGVGKSRTFEINLAGQGRPARRSTIIGEFLLGRARALVFRFVARVVADGAMAFLERNVKSGLVTMRGDPLEWHPKPPAALEATRTRTLHILLFIHGTFSSTRGSFGALGLTEGGKALLERAAAKYDQVIGFDHPTLSVDPRHNADDLVAALEQISGGHPLHIDVVSYSRGGLVYRALAQRLAARREISFGRVCFIAVPNAGTTLAESKNWRQLADLYTNVAMAGLRLLQFLPGAVSASLVAKETIKSVGAFVRYLTSYAIDEMAVPGLAAMRPHGTFLESLAASGASEEFRCVVISSFEAPALSDDDVAGLPRQILTTVADGVIDQLLGSDNDLVVNTASMTDFGQGVSRKIDDTLDFGVTSQVYHTNYFIRPEMAQALSRWLQLVDDPVTVAARRRGGSATADTEPFFVAKESEDLVVVDYADPLRHVLDLSHPGGPEFVVIRRPHGGKVLNYAFRPSEVVRLVGDRPILDVLQLKEESSSAEVQGTVTGYAPQVRRSGPPSEFRGVVVEGGEPIAVIHADVEEIESKAEPVSWP